MPCRPVSRWARGRSCSTPSRSTSIRRPVVPSASSGSNGSSRRDVTAGPRRRRHDPLAPAGSGRVEPPQPSSVDLHTHTTRSDGVVSPADLLRDVADAGVRLLALTDHDTLAGY